MLQVYDTGGWLKLAVKINFRAGSRFEGEEWNREQKWKSQMSEDKVYNSKAGDVAVRLSGRIRGLAKDDLQMPRSFEQRSAAIEYIDVAQP